MRFRISVVGWVLGFASTATLAGCELEQFSTRTYFAELGVGEDWQLGANEPGKAYFPQWPAELESYTLGNFQEPVLHNQTLAAGNSVIRLLIMRSFSGPEVIRVEIRDGSMALVQKIASRKDTDGNLGFEARTVQVTGEDREKLTAEIAKVKDCPLTPPEPVVTEDGTVILIEQADGESWTLEYKSATEYCFDLAQFSLDETWEPLADQMYKALGHTPSQIEKSRYYSLPIRAH